mmetsp:Transcript_10555/g.32738  ORF Transcript_10555/g.32738 Transcript_10555/m.32738 type:complete len:242 (+) Transcript_10555:467-1192(+)
MIEVAATCAAPRPSSRRSALRRPRLSSRPISNKKKHTPRSARRCVRPTSEMTARPCGPSRAPEARKAKTGDAPKPLNPGTATANASNTAKASRRAPALNNVANASPRKLFSRTAARGARRPHAAATAPADTAAAPLHFGRATALLTFDTSFVVNVGGGRGASAAGAALCVVVGRSCGSAAAAPRRAAANCVGGGAQARAVVAVSSTSGRRILSCRYRGASPVAVAVAVLCFASLATGLQQF